MFTRNDLRALMVETARPAVSIFLPTHIKGREIRQDPIRLKNLLSEAEDRLTASSMRAETARHLLAPGRRLLDDELFWRHQDQGLALFLAPDAFHCHKVPAELSEQVVIGPVFHVKPLLSLLVLDGRFFLVTISAARVRLFEGSRFSLAERSDVRAPQGVAEIAAETDYEQVVDAKPVARRRSGMPGGVPEKHNFGESPEELRKTEQIEYLRRAAAAIEDTIGADPAPVLVAADAQNRGHFLKLAKLRGLQRDGLELNPESLTPSELHRLAHEHIRPQFQAMRDQALNRFNTLAGNEDARAALRIEDILKASRHGRVDILLLADGEDLWGRFDEAAGQITAHGTPQPDDMELLGYAAVQTLLQGGQVDLVPKAEMPRGAGAAAILRY